MKKKSYFFLGMAIQSFAVALLQITEMIKVTPTQQGLAGIIFLSVMVITMITGKR
ncbi:hypothetical protein ACFL0L_04740 [Patescibacteria group bacterium]